MTSPHLWPAVLAGAALAVAPVGGPTLAKPRPGTPAVHAVTIAAMAFGPTPAAIHVGDTVEWVNNDIFVHSATAADKSFDVELKPKARMWTTFHRAGTYAFSCRYHPGMRGTLVVRPQGR